MIWEVQVAQEGREGLVHQILDLPVKGKGEEEEGRREDHPLIIHVVSYHKSQHDALLYLLSFGSRCSIQTWKALRSSLTLEVII